MTAANRPSVKLPEEPQVGLYEKYEVRRRDGRPLKGGMCIVLELGDPNAWPALRTWANTVEADGYGDLAADVRAAVDRAADQWEREAVLDVQ